jgi:hypothetical protein
MKKVSDDPVIDDRFRRSVKEMKKFIKQGEQLINQVEDKELQKKLKVFFLA